MRRFSIQQVCFKSISVGVFLFVLATPTFGQESAVVDAAVSVDALPESMNEAIAPTSPGPGGETTSLADGDSKPYSVLDQNDESDDKEPWDYSPYRVLIWIASEAPEVNLEMIEKPLRTYLDRDFAALWRVEIAKAPTSVQTVALRQIDNLSYDSITGADPVLAVKRDHKDAVRIRNAKQVAEFCQKIYLTKDRMQSNKRRGAEVSNESIDGVVSRFEAVEGDALAVRKLWADEKTESILVSRGMALTLAEPKAKLVPPPISGLVADSIDRYDKIFVVSVQRNLSLYEIKTTELDTLMRHFGPVASTVTSSRASIAEWVGRGITEAFSPIVRIDNAGQRTAQGLLRGGGLIIDENSPGGLRKGDVLEPLSRKNDRNGKPIQIGMLDWAYLVVDEVNESKTKMDFYAGRVGGLQGRKNKRTFRTALKVRSFRDATLVRLHLQKDPNFPLIGYELYQKELKSTKMTFVGRTDWNGRLLVDRTDDPLRLFYVKNGGAVLARLPVVPGLYSKAVADLSGDDMRLQAEAYIRGVQNSIVDLVAVRELFKARIRLRLEKGEMEKAEELMNALRDQPSNEKLANELGKKQSVFLEALGRSAGSQRRKVDSMFTNTRELLGKHINPRLIRELEADMVAARNNGGKLPRKKEEKQEKPAEGKGKKPPANKKGAASKGKPASEDAPAA